MGYVEFEQADANWAGRFVRTRTRVDEAVAGGLLGVFHVGSTAIPALPAKPTLDAVAVFEHRDAMATGRSALLDAGFSSHRDDSDWGVLTDNVEAKGDAYGVCLHLRPRTNSVWCDQLVFREYLREDVRARAVYERAKHAAAERHPDDVDAYVDAKADTIQRLVEEAYELGYGHRLPAFAPRDRGVE